MLTRAISALVVGVLAAAPLAAQRDIADRVEHHYADSEGVRIHYVTVGEGPLVVMIHGFPDFWYTWRHQMAALEGEYRVAAMDQRGYNLSDKPEGVESYDLSLLVQDVEAVIRDQGQESAIVVGHDWGGWVAWMVAMSRPELVDRLIVLKLPRPRASGGSWPTTRISRRTVSTHGTSSSRARTRPSRPRGSRSG